MEYLRSLGSAAASSILQKSGLNLPFSLGERVAELGIWTVHDATKRDDSMPVTVFVWDASTRRGSLALAKNAVRKLRTIRHPDVLKFIDAVEGDTLIYIMTERVRPLKQALEDGKKGKERTEWLVWGLHRVSVALAFINDSASSTHGAIRVDSVLITPSGEWKLGGFDLLSNPTDDAAVLYSLGGTLPDASTYQPPEVRKGGYAALKESDPLAADAYALGILIHSVFNPSSPLPPTTQPPHPPIAGSSREQIPAGIFAHYKRLLNPNPKARLGAKGFLELGMDESTGFFAGNPLVKVCAGLDTFAMMSEGEKSSFIGTLGASSASFPSEFNAHRVLPSLVSALEFGGGTASAIIPLVINIGKDSSSASFSKPGDASTNVWLTPVLKLFASPDRATRMVLLTHLPSYAPFLTSNHATTLIWPHLSLGLSDTVPLIREASIRSLSTLAPLLSDRIKNNDLLRHLAKLQLDPEPSIRTNTCILLAKLAPGLQEGTRKKVLVPAYARACKDAFGWARVAGVEAFLAGVGGKDGKDGAVCFDEKDVAERVVPVVSGCLVDREKIVRDAAFKAIDVFMARLRKHAETLPDTPAPPPATSVESTASGTETGAAPLGYGNAAGGSGGGGGMPGGFGVGGGMAGWAIQSLGKQLGAPDSLISSMQTASALLNTSGLGVVDRPMSAPPAQSQASSSGLSGTASSGLSGGVVPPPLVSTKTTLGATAGGTSKAKSMQLGATKTPRSLSAKIVADEDDWGAPATTGGKDAWGDDAEDGQEADEDVGDAWAENDLMDVNADADDWSAFESAPVPGALNDTDNPWADSQSSSPSLTRAAPSVSAPAKPAAKPKPQPISALAAAPAPTPAPVKKEPPPPVRASALARIARPAATFTAGPIPAPVVKPKPKAPAAGDGWADDGWGKDADDGGEEKDEGHDDAKEGKEEKTMTKEEKAAEMARRREERKQRIAAAKEKRGTKG